MQKLLMIIADYTLSDLLYDLVLVGIAYGYVALTIAIPVFLKKKNIISKFHARKIVHLFTGLIVLIVPFFIMPLFAVFIALSLAIVVYFSSRDSSVKQLQELYESIGEEAEEKSGRLEGPFFYSVSITFLIAIFVLFAPDRLYFPICGILIMIISDTFASVVGKKYGKLKINIAYTGTVRTVEGSLTFFVSAFILCFAAFYFFGLLNPINQHELTIRTVVAYSFITSGVGTVIELLSPSTIDDLTVPIGTTMVIYLLSLLG
jgi:phytol kinase